MKFACAGHDVVLLEELIFVIAGHNGEHYLNSSECFNPSTGQWAEISSMADVQRSAAAMAVDGKIVVVGRFGDMTDVNVKSSCQ